MGLTQTQRSILAKAQSVGGSKQGVVLDDETCAYLVGVIARDLGLKKKIKAVPANLPPFFGTQSLDSLRLPGAPFPGVFEQLAALDKDAETYFACLAALHKRLAQALATLLLELSHLCCGRLVEHRPCRHRCRRSVIPLDCC